ncbi:MAG: hypothetical protein CVU54_10945 [Deltaproteobacteria bacterium HGW-Deltaproteobacteria-12]|jgi:hypothetical protein|nr:MAG: hypothetical protein CVU54_10945 [Deltaproteobacteria bacterium HGW-Deltaproteobacteria-12]
MKNNSRKSGMKMTALGLLMPALIGCSGYHTQIKKPEVKSIPEDKYERIIKLSNPEGEPDRSLAGLIFIKKGAGVCTNYPREESITSLEELQIMEKSSYRFFSTYAIKVGEETFGFIAIPLGYRANIWENKKNTECRFLVDIVLPESTKGNSGPFTGGGIFNVSP